MRQTYSPDFELVWAAYPWKSKKGDAFKAWKALKPDADLVRAVLEALVWQVAQPRWTKDGGAYIPLMGTWLRANCWEDQPFEPLPVDPRQLPAGKETAAQHTIRTGRETLDLLNEMEARERKAIR